jgi:hypothetical protein
MICRVYSYAPGLEIVVYHGVGRFGVLRGHLCILIDGMEANLRTYNEHIG